MEMLLTLMSFLRIPFYKVQQQPLLLDLNCVVMLILRLELAFYRLHLVTVSKVRYTGPNLLIKNNIVKFKKDNDSRSYLQCMLRYFLHLVHLNLCKYQMFLSYQIKNEAGLLFKSH